MGCYFFQLKCQAVRCVAICCSFVSSRFASNMKYLFLVADESSPLISMGKKDTLIPGHCIKLQDTIGQGTTDTLRCFLVSKCCTCFKGCFGVVHKGYLYGWQDRTEPVAIKILKSKYRLLLTINC